ncbi:type II toxin-antitoxin system RelE/ParE family toxin [Sutcliffiella horikoshii]|uniref:type II toxin-antitoxin system RelE/ParE family toxin n=1 Tax=Sutcliffiella horikoshii TaxID=79883 RepID=UPI00384BDCE7
MAEIRWSPSAVQDLEEICSFIAKDSVEYASFTAKGILHTIETASVFPFSGKVVPELENEFVREKIYSSYRVIYRCKDEMLEVVRIIHHARDLNTMGEYE